MIRRIPLLLTILAPLIGLCQIQSPLLDPSFGPEQGLVRTGTDFLPKAVVEDPDTELLFVLGDIEDGGSSHMAVRCYQTNGSLHTSWGTAGQTIVDFGAPGFGADIDIEKFFQSQFLYLTGMIDDGINRWGIAKLDLNTGLPDMSFGTSGKVIASPGASNTPKDIMVLPNGGFMVSGETGFDIAAGKFLSNGTIDPTFGINGYKTLDVASPTISAGYMAGGFSQEGPGGVLLAGIGTVNNERSVLISLLDQQGNAVPTFGNNGVMTLTIPNFEIAFALRYAQDRGALVLAVDASNGGNDVVGWWSMDPTDWSMTGPHLIDQGYGSHLTGLDFVGDKVVICTVTEEPTKHVFTLNQFLEDGSIDPGFGFNGSVQLDSLSDYLDEGTGEAKIFVNDTFLFLENSKGLISCIWGNSTEEEGLLIRIGQGTPFPEAPDSLQIISLNHGQHEARVLISLDLDADGDLDVVTHSGQTLYQVENLGQAENTPYDLFDPTWREIVTLPGYLHDLDTADANGDGFPEIVLSLQNGLITFDLDSLNCDTIRDEFHHFNETETGDVDGNGRTDILTIDRTDGRLILLKNMGIHNWVEVIVEPNIGSAKFLKLADLDDDLDLDLVVAGDWTIPGGSDIWYNDGNGNFTANYPLVPGATSDLHVTDVDQDGTQELLYYDISGPAPDLWVLELTDPLSPPQKLVEDVTGSGWYAEVDGQPGLEGLIFNKVSRFLCLTTHLSVGSTNPKDSIAYFPHANLQFFDGPGVQGSHPFMANVSNNGASMQMYQLHPTEDMNFWNWPSTFAYHPDELTDLDLVDVNGDGDLDIVAVDAGRPNNPGLGSRLLYYENVNGYLFTSHAPQLPKQDIRSLEVVDLHGDGATEFIYTSGLAPDLGYAQLFGEQDFNDALFSYGFQGGEALGHLTVGEFDGQPGLDAVACAPDDQTLWTFENIESGTPSQIAWPNVNFTPLEPTVFPAYFDTMMVIVLTDQDVRRCNYLSQVCVPLEGQPQDMLPSDILTADVNQDGLEDVLISYNPSSGGNGGLSLIMVGISLHGAGFVWYNLPEVADEVLAMAWQYDPELGNLLFLAQEQTNAPHQVQILNWQNENFTDVASLIHEMPQAASITEIRAGDLNQDGLTDYVCLDPQSGNIWLALVDSLPSTTPPTSLPEWVRESPSIQLYPHPASDMVHLQSPAGPIVSVSLFNLAGQQVLTQSFVNSFPTVQLDISLLPPGFYPGQVRLQSQQVYPIKLEVK